ncbi:MAG: DNA polymerase III subunit epsilon [Woeseiaceae bacterium]
MRQIVLDTETTGLSPSQGHRIIEIGCLELVDRRLTGREFHCFLHPDREIDEAAQRVHGISLDDLATAPRFPEVVEEFLEFIASAELVIHNAEFDVGFIEHEMKLMGHAQPQVTEHATVLDTLALARKMHPGQRNSLDALCKRYEVDASNRDVHGALIDSDLLARVYLAMTGGQTALSLDAEIDDAPSSASRAGDTISGAGHENGSPVADLKLVVIKASKEEAAAHDALLEKIASISGRQD